MNKIRFGIAGTGRISDWILRGAVMDSRFVAVAVCSRSAERARDFINRHPEAFAADAVVFTSIEEMSACPRVDAVYIGTPNSVHRPYALSAIAAGKHVLCEKPMGVNFSEVKEMSDAASSRGVVLMEAMISLLNPLFRQAREKMPELGPIRQYNSSYCQYSSKYDALKRGVAANSFNPRMGGGALQDIGIYTTYPLVSLFGYPEEVKSNLLHVPTDAGDVNIHGSVSVKYPGMTANLVFSKAVDSSAPTEICGEKGNIILDQVHIVRKVDFKPHGTPSSGRGRSSAAVTIAEGLPMDEYYYEFKEFMDVIESGRHESEINSLRTALLNARLMDEILGR